MAGWLLVAHACGWLGTVSGMLMTLAPSKPSMMALGFLCSAFQIVHFRLVPGGSSGLGGQVVMLFMCLFGMYDAEHAWARWGYWLLYPALAALARDHLHRAVDLLPILASFLSVAARHQPTMFRVRFLSMFASVPWIPYCLAIGSYSNLLGMTFWTVLAVIAFVQYHGADLLQATGGPSSLGNRASKRSRRVWYEYFRPPRLPKRRAMKL